MIVTDSRTAKKIQSVFEADWAERAERGRSGRGYSCFRRSMTPESMTVAGRGDGVEVELVAVDLGGEERLIGVEADRRQAGSSGRCCPCAASRRIR